MAEVSKDWCSLNRVQRDMAVSVVVARAFFALDIVKFNTILPIIYLFKSFTGSLTVASFNDATVKEPVKNVNR